VILDLSRRRRPRSRRARPGCRWSRAPSRPRCAGANRRVVGRLQYRQRVGATRPGPRSRRPEVADRVPAPW